MSAITYSIRRTRNGHRPLLVFTGLMVVLTLAASVGLFTDDRVLGGAPIWLKPFKFAVSFVIYGATMAWIISRLPARRRWAWAIGVVIVVASMVEIVIIFLQAGRGTYSHYNVATPLDTALWTGMGGFVVLLWLATLVVAVFAALGTFGDRPGTLAIRFGLGLSLVGMALGYLMATPSAAQIDAISRGTATLAGAHSVGVPDGGPGLPVTAWSVTGGDLRVSHFVGIHALQALPLLAWLLARPGLALAERARTRLVVTGGIGYLTLVGLLLWQALRGQPMTAPDGLALGALGALGSSVAIAVTVIVVGARRSSTTSEVAR